MLKKLIAKTSVSPALVKSKTARNSAISARQRNKIIVNSSFGAVHLKVKRSVRPLAAMLFVSSGVVSSPLGLLYLYYLGQTSSYLILTRTRLFYSVALM